MVSFAGFVFALNVAFCAVIVSLPIQGKSGEIFDLFNNEPDKIPHSRPPHAFNAMFEMYMGGAYAVFAGICLFALLGYFSRRLSALIMALDHAFLAHLLFRFSPHLTWSTESVRALAMNSPAFVIHAAFAFLHLLVIVFPGAKRSSSGSTSSKKAKSA